MIFRRTCRAPLGIPLAQNYRSVPPLRKLLYHFESFFYRQELPAQPHLDVIALPLRRAFRMETDKTQRRPGFARCRVASARAMFQKRPQKLRGILARGSRSVRSANPGVRNSPQDSLRRMVI